MSKIGKLIEVIAVEKIYHQHWLKKKHVGILVDEKENFIEILSENDGVVLIDKSSVIKINAMH